MLWAPRGGGTFPRAMRAKLAHSRCRCTQRYGGFEEGQRGNSFQNIIAVALCVRIKSERERGGRVDGGEGGRRAKEGQERDAVLPMVASCRIEMMHCATSGVCGGAPRSTQRGGRGGDAVWRVQEHRVVLVG